MFPRAGCSIARYETDPQACEDYRAAATIDLEHDRESISRGVKIGVSRLKVLWGAAGVINKYDDPVQVWRDYSEAGVDVSGKAVQSGHYIPEHAPEEMLQELEGFYS
jgi:haloacetate dehalogenase